MVTLWYVIMLMILCTVVILLPFAMFMYETDEEKTLVRNYQSFYLFLMKFNKLKDVKSLLCFLLYICCNNSSSFIARHILDILEICRYSTLSH